MLRGRLLLWPATAGPVPIARGEKAPDRVEHELMVVRPGDRRTVFTEVTGFFHSSGNRAREYHFDVRIILAYPGLEYEASPLRHIAIREHEVDLIRRAKQLARFGCVDRFEHTIAAFTQIFRQGIAHDNVTFNKQNARRWLWAHSGRSIFEINDSTCSIL
jgi:hypothetical protein